MFSLRSLFFRLVPGFILLLCTFSYGQTNFAVLTGDGAWTWYNDPRALFLNGKLYFGCVRAADSKTALSVFNLQTGGTTNLWTAGFTQFDDHNVPGLLPLQDGRLLAVYARHGADQYFSYRWSNSTDPMAPADWNTEQSIANTGASMTYANPFQLAAEGGKVYNFCRNLNYNPTVFVSTNAGSNWSSPQLFIQTGTGGSIRPYVKYSSDYTQRIDFLYTDGHPRDVANSLYHLYYQGGNFHRTDGTFVKSYAGLPILHDSGERGSVIYQYSDAAQSDPNQWIPTGRAWCWEIASQADGAPACVFTVQRDLVTGSTSGVDDRIYYYYARWTGTNWQKRFIAHAGRPLYVAEDDYAGGICIDPLNPGVVYISSNAGDPFNLADTTNVPLRANERYELWRGITADGGLTFSWTQITSNSAVDNLRPYVPRRNGGEACVLWFRGTYSTYTSYSCSIVGLFTTAVPPSLADNGTWSSDADGLWGDAGNWSGGVIAGGEGNTADFSALDISADRTVTLDASRTIGSLRFGDTLGAQSWRVEPAGGSTLTLAGAPIIDVLQNTAVLAVPLAGTAGLTKNGAGTLVLAASNAISGTLNLDRGSSSANDGAVRITSSGALANVASPIAFRNNSGAAATGTLQLDGTAGDITVAQDFSTSCRNNNTTPTFESLAGTNTLAGNNAVQVGGTNVLYRANAGSLLRITGSIQYVGSFTAARTFAFGGDGDIEVSGAILDSANGASVNLARAGTGTLTLSGANTFRGFVWLNGGAVAFQSADNFGVATNSLNFNGGTLQFTPGNAADISSRVIRLHAGGAVLDTGANDVALAGGIGASGPGALTKTGAGMLTLGGANTYTGGTIVSNGTLRINGSLAGGTARVAAGTLSGAGTIGGSVVVESAGTLSPGAGAGAIGLLAIGGSLSLSGNTCMDVNKEAGTRDQVSGPAAIVYGGTLTVTNLAGELAAGDSFAIFPAASFAGNFTQIDGAAGAGLTFSFNPTNGLLSVISSAADYPTNLNYSIGNNLLSVSWPATHLGWVLQSQTNGVDAGIVSHPSSWHDVAGSSSGITWDAAIDPANPAVFFRLRHP